MASASNSPPSASRACSLKTLILYQKLPFTSSATPPPCRLWGYLALRDRRGRGTDEGTHAYAKGVHRGEGAKTAPAFSYKRHGRKKIGRCARSRIHEFLCYTTCRIQVKVGHVTGIHLVLSLCGLDFLFRNPLPKSGCWLSSSLMRRTISADCRAMMRISAGCSLIHVSKRSFASRICHSCISFPAVPLPLQTRPIFRRRPAEVSRPVRLFAELPHVSSRHV